MIKARTVARLLVATLLVASLLPIPNWIPSERSLPWYPMALRGWLLGLWVVGGGALALALYSRGEPRLWRPGALSEALARLDPRNPLTGAALGGLAFLCYLGVAIVIFGRRPLLVDEIVLLFQARTYAAGHLALPVDPDPAFRSMLHLVEHQGKWFGHFPPGWPLVLALGERFGVPWIIGPLAGGVAVWAFGLVVARAESEPSVRAGAVLLFALAPFSAFMAGSAMNHTGVLMWLLLALAGWLALLERPRLLLGLGVGLAFGMAAITRPPDAVAFGLPALVWAAIAWRGRPMRSLLGLALGIAGPVAVMLVTDRATTGEAFLSGYQMLWGPNVGLGFHPAPYGPAHTVLRGVELVSLYLFRLNVYLFEAPIPGLLPAGLALLLARQLGPTDRFLLAASALLLLIYFAYWHDGFFLGPRFVYPLIPMVALWTARLPRVAALAWGALGQRVAGYGMALAVVGAAGLGIPERAGANAAIQPALRFDPDRAADQAGIGNAIIFVRESWGSELLARLWALGASRPAAERFYKNIDACQLDQALRAAEAAPSSMDLSDLLAPLMADSAKLLPSPFSADTSLRALNGASYDAVCMARIRDGRDAPMLLAPTLLSRRPDLLFVRDLHERNASLLVREPDRPVFLLTRPSADSAPVFRPLSRDSLLRLAPGQ